MSILLEKANECLQPHGVEICLGISVPESKFSERQGYDLQCDKGYRDEIKAQFQIWEGKELKYSSDDWWKILDWIKDEFGSRFVGKTGLSKLKFAPNDDDDY